MNGRYYRSHISAQPPRPGRLSHSVRVVQPFELPSLVTISFSKHFISFDNRTSTTRTFICSNTVIIMKLSPTNMRLPDWKAGKQPEHTRCIHTSASLPLHAVSLHCSACSSCDSLSFSKSLHVPLHDSPQLNASEMIRFA